MGDSVAASRASVEDILRQFGHLPGNLPNQVFGADLIRVSNQIRGIYRYSDYDHRPELPPPDKSVDYLQTEEFRIGYACFKHCVAKVIEPRTICEIGIGGGMGARAFLAASPSAHYLGIDDGSKQRDDHWPFIDYVRQSLQFHKYSFEFQIIDSTNLAELPHADLFHVDGAHDFNHAFNDVKLAVQSDSEWILVDDARDAVVMAAAFCVLQITNRAYEWAYFDDTWTGNLLIRRR